MPNRRAVFIPYRPKTILNKGKRADHWFWTRYSAYPYLGCQHGCQFCYCREQKYSPYDDPTDFAFVIKVKENAPELLRKALRNAPVDVVFTGDYQPAERKFRVSRRMLEVCCELGFPVFVLERSPLVLRDLDLLQEIHRKARVVVAFSIISTPDSGCYTDVRRMENLAPPPEKRFAAMEKLAEAGIPTGICAMPLLPGLCDEVENLENLARWTAGHGGGFILSSGLTLSDQQRAFFLNALSERFPDLLPLYQKLYPTGSYGAATNRIEIPRRVRELCYKFGLSARIPRPIIPGEKRALNKRIVEQMASKLYDLELDGAPEARQWVYRKAAWAVEDLEQDIGLVYRTMGLKGLGSISNVGVAMAGVIEGMIKDLG
jgi:DNA repair photolyase